MSDSEPNELKSVDPDAPKGAVSTVDKFATEHGDGATAVLQYVGRSAVRVTLVGADGTLGDVVVPDMETAEQVVARSTAKQAEWDRELAAEVKTPKGLAKKMAGYLARDK